MEDSKETESEGAWFVWNRIGDDVMTKDHHPLSTTFSLKIKIRTVQRHLDNIFQLNSILKFFNVGNNNNKFGILLFFEVFFENLFVV